MAGEYRNRFKKDFLIDLIGYRRYGHNESDDPETTQPLVYSKVKNHPTVSKLYAQKLIRQGIVDEAFNAGLIEKVQNRLKEAHEHVKNNPEEEPAIAPSKAKRGQDSVVRTAVELKKLRQINENLLKW